MMLRRTGKLSRPLRILIGLTSMVLILWLLPGGMGLLLLCGFLRLCGCPDADEISLS